MYRGGVQNVFPLDIFPRHCYHSAISSLDRRLAAGSES